jgi:hypothetical protein
VDGASGAKKQDGLKWLEFRVSSFEFRVSRFEFRVSRFEVSRFQGSEFQGFKVSRAVFDAGPGYWPQDELEAERAIFGLTSLSNANLCKGDLTSTTMDSLGIGKYDRLRTHQPPKSQGKAYRPTSVGDYHRCRISTGDPLLADRKHGASDPHRCGGSVVRWVEIPFQVAIGLN